MCSHNYNEFFINGKKQKILYNFVYFFFCGMIKTFTGRDGPFICKGVGCVKLEERGKKSLNEVGTFEIEPSRILLRFT